MKHWPALLLLLVVGLSACTSPAPPLPHGYYGPTLPLPELIGRINENNAKIPTLWAHEHFSATLVDRQANKSAHIDGYGALLYTAPNQMKLTAKDEFVDLFEMGSNGKQFWLWEKHDQVFWWGDYASEQNIQSAQIPVRPDMVMEMLGVRPIDGDLLSEPFPTVRFNNAADAYMVDWHSRTPGEWVVAKEIWYDRATLHPMRVLLFDAQGHVALWAHLTNFVPIKLPDDPEQSHWPFIASQYELYFPYSGTRMSFELSDVSLTRSGRPNGSTYLMPDPARLSDSGVRVNHIDAEHPQ
jgi:hypothetical protein